MTVQMLRGDCLERLKEVADASVDLVLTDPPYYKVKDEPWDRQWDRPEEFLCWLDQVVAECARVLKPTGSLYLFASPQMRGRVEMVVRSRLNVLNTITWRKPSGYFLRQKISALRGYATQTEAIIFAEHYGAHTKRGDEYTRTCDELRAVAFEPLRKYLADERDRAGLTTRDVAVAFQQKTGSKTVTGMAGHWFERVQWTLPTRGNYEWLRGIFERNKNGDFLTRPFDELKREYDLAAERLAADKAGVDHLRRCFAVEAGEPYTDVWDFGITPQHADRHVCEKPQPLLEHIIKTSSRPGDVVLDCFAGTGSTGEAAVGLERRFIGVEMADAYFDTACRRIAAAQCASRPSEPCLSSS